MSGMDAVAAECALALPEDIVADIIARVTDMVSLFRCAVSCKPWLRLVADPAFLRRCRWPDGGRPSLLGFLVQRHHHTRRKNPGLAPTLAPVFVPAPGSPLGPERRSLTSFVRDDDAGVLDHAKPLAARGGLLLVHLLPRSGVRNTLLRLCVCNLLTGRRNLLPALDAAGFDGEGVRGYAVLTAADHGAAPCQPADGYTTFFQVLLIAVARDDGKLCILTFSSSSAAAAAPRGWSSYTSDVQIPEDLHGPYGCRVAAVTQGTAHWLFLGSSAARPYGGHPRLFLLGVRIDMGSVGVTEIELPCIHEKRNDAWLCACGGDGDARLSLLLVHSRSILIWTRKEREIGTVGWHVTEPVYVSGVDDVQSARMESLSIACDGEKSSTVLLLYDSQPDVAYMLDLRSGSTTKVAGWQRSFDYRTAVPYEINWPEFFMSRLGTLV